MKLKSITIVNVKSFRDKTTIEFDKNLNILIGSNAGGKSNLLDIITVVIRGLFVKIFSIQEQSNQFRQILTINPAPSSNLIQDLEKFIGNDNNNSSIEVTFEVTKEDIENINKIKSKKEIFKRNLENYSNGTNLIGVIDSVCQSLENHNLREGMEVSYTTAQNYVINPPTGDNEKAYLSYLNNFELLLILSDEEISFKYFYLYFSPYRAMNISNLQTNSDQNFYQLYQNYALSTSKYLPSNSPTSLIQVSSLYFSQKIRKLESDAKYEGYYYRWKEDEEVKLVTKYLKKVDYDWDIEHVIPNKNFYELIIKNDIGKFLISQASSGEKEIINFLLGISALNIRNGLIIIDELELHLHPKWQMLLMDIFTELSNETGNQFIISTHSPVLINEKTISNVIRIYKDKGISKNVKIKETNLPDVKDLLHIVNSHNNEKLFFADKIVLVEGITDRLIFEKLISFYQSKKNEHQVVEVLEVHGKNNFDKYMQILKEIKCKSYIIADLDYVKELTDKDKNEKIKEFFDINHSSISKTIKDKKSYDGKKLSELIEEAIMKNKITEELKNTYNYIKYRHLKLRDDLTEEEINELKEYIEQKGKENIFILHDENNLERTDIEDFLPKGYKDLNGIIKLTKPDSDIFKEWFENDTEQERGGYLKEIIQNILDLNN